MEVSRKIEKPIYDFEFSICTLVTKKQEYEEMLNSFLAKGFTTDICEYLYVDNTQGCSFDAYQGLNLFLQQAKGQYIIICHQDVLIYKDDINDLRKRIAEVDTVDPKWGILANAGGINLKYVAMHVTQNTGNELTETIFPLRLQTVDENFILAKNAANLALSSNLHGFHMYGSDICLIAEFLGYSSYLIDFRLLHKSDGNADHSFFRLKRELKNKYQKAYRPRFISTTITRYYLSGNKIGCYFFNSWPLLFLVRQYFKFFKPKKYYKH